MKPREKFTRDSFHLAAVCMLLLCTNAFAQQITNVEEAYQYLNSKSSTFPNDFTPQDQESFAVFRKYPAEAKRLLVAKILAGEQKEPRVFKFLTPLPIADRRDVMREVISHYQYGDLATPFTGFLAYFGEAEDMDRLKKLISLHPDREGMAGLAVLMAESDNPHAHAALLELRDAAPGKWQERREIQQFFAKARLSAATPASVTAVTPPTPAPPLTPNNTQPKPVVSAPVTSKPEGVSAVSSPPLGRGWLLGLGGALLAAVILLIFFKKTKG